MQLIKIIRRVSLSFFSILVFQSSFCQENYLPGSIIDLNGDSINGFIDYQNWKKNPDLIYFMHKTDSIRFPCTPHDIKGFSVSDEHYISAVIKTENSPDRADKLSYFKELSIEVDTAFLQVMILGSKSLYYFEKISGKGQFYFKTDSSYELLVYKRYLKKQNGNNLIIENSLYKGQLAVYLQDCPEIQKILSYTKYNKLSMEKLFNYYYSNTLSEINFQKTTEKLVTEFGLLAGASITTLKFHTVNPDYSYLANTDYGLSLNISPGLFFDIVLPRNLRKFSMCNELIFTSYNLDGQTTGNLSNTTIETKFGYSYIKMNNLLRYKYPEGKSFVFFNAGISNGIALNEINILKVDGIEISRALAFTRKHEQGLLFGGGIKNNKFSYEIRFERGNGMSRKTTTSSKTNRYYLIFGYKF